MSTDNSFDARRSGTTGSIPLAPTPPILGEKQTVAPSPPKRSSSPILGIIKFIGILLVVIVVGVGGLTLMRSFHSTSQNTNPSSEKVTLTWWGLWEDPNVMNSIINDFERTNPNITINYVRQDPKQYTDRLLARTKNGTGPDIFQYHNTWLPIMFPILSPLPQNVLTKDEFAQDFYPVVKQDLVQNGGIYGIPLEIDTLALFTNTDLFNKERIQPPTNWTDFITDSKALTLKDANGKIIQAGAALGTYDNITHAPDILSLLFVQNGVDLNNFSQGAQNASDALTFYTSFAKGDANVWDESLNPSLTAFTNGQLAMYFGYSWDVVTIKAENPNLQFSINPVPHLPGRSMTIASYWVEGVSRGSKYQNQANLFMKYLAQKETEQKLYSEQSKIRPFGEPFARVDLADSVKDNPFIYTFLSQAQNAVSSYFAGETQDDMFNGQLNNYLSTAINTVLKTDTSADSAVATLSQGVAQVLSQYGAH